MRQTEPVLQLRQSRSPPTISIYCAAGSTLPCRNDIWTITNTPSKHNVQCVPSSPAPPRKRRQPMKELLERLAACEERLKMCRCHENGQAAQGQQPMSEHLDATHDHAHHHYPPSPPASAASRDAAIANVLDYGDEMEQRNAARYSEHYV